MFGFVQWDNLRSGAILYDSLSDTLSEKNPFTWNNARKLVCVCVGIGTLRRAARMGSLDPVKPFTNSTRFPTECGGAGT